MSEVRRVISVCTDVTKGRTPRWGALLIGRYNDEYRYGARSGS